jgi:5-formyltetrahydrofolate cyclo-ligase
MAVPSPSSPPPDKGALRAEGLRRRRDFARSLTPELRARLQAELARLVLPHLAAARVVAAYHPLKDEIDPAAILAGLDEGQRRALPWFADRNADFIWREGPATEPGPWGVGQPPAEAEALLPDAVIVPLVLADRSGTRIGHGKGHYDRALAHLREGGRPVLTIGICWETQLIDAPIPADPWDMKLDAVATPREWLQCG